MKFCPKIILEGTRLTHKTDIAFALNEHPRIVGPRKYRYHSPLISAEWCGFTNYPWGRGLINFEAQEEALAMETYQTWGRLFQQLLFVDRRPVPHLHPNLPVHPARKNLRLQLAGTRAKRARLPAGILHTRTRVVCEGQGRTGEGVGKTVSV
jgi:hypothetical protein